jgi:hypothetical protein
MQKGSKSWTFWRIVTFPFFVGLQFIAFVVALPAIRVFGGKSAYHDAIGKS